jgi:hypothetical protein
MPTTGVPKQLPAALKVWPRLDGTSLALLWGTI